MTTSISSTTNASGITVGSDGKIKASGYSSGIDWQSLIDAQITAKSVGATTLQTKITNNKTKISAYTELKTKMTAFADALKALSGSASSTSSVFATKSVTGTSALADTAPSGATASSVSDMLIVSTTTSAQNASHTIQVTQLAAANQIRTDAFTSTNTALSTLGYETGDFTLNGKTISVSSTDTLLDLKSRINNAGAGVTATIVTSDASTNYLVLTADSTGASNAITITGNDTLTNSLNLTQTVSATTSIKNTLVTAKDAILNVDGITGITRSSNSISDIIDGVTLSLQKADVNTVLTLKIEPDLTGIETAINTFATAYNDVRTYVTDQRTNKDWNGDGTTAGNEYGPLAYDQTLRDMLAHMSDIATGLVAGNNDGYRSLSQVGIVMQSDYTLKVDNTILDSKLLSNESQIQKLFGLSTSTSDSRLLVTTAGNTASGTYTVNLGGTDGNAYVTSANISNDASGAASGADDGTMTVANKLLTATSTSDANGLGLYFGGAANLGAISGLTVTVSRGVADNAYNYFNNIITDTSGTLDTLITQLKTQDTEYQTQIDTINTRMETLRATLTTKYTNMETALATLANVKNMVTSLYNSTTGTNGNN